MSSENENKALLQQLRINRDDEQKSIVPRRVWLIGALVIVLAALGVLGWRYFAGGERFTVESVVASPPAQGAKGAIAAAVLQATGYVTARREATVSTQITGTLTQVLIEEGDHVKAGQVLARLDDTAQRAGLAQAQAQEQSAEALLAQFRASLEQARRDLVRNEDLVARQLVSQQALETARTLVETAAAQVESQRRQLQLARASVDGAQVQLGYTVVHAPFSGVVIAKAAQAGEIVSPISAGGGFTRTGVGTIVDMDSLEIDVDVNEAYINRVQPGQAAQATLDAYPDWNIPAHVIAIIPTADRSKATVKVRIGLDLKDPRILPDMGVRVSFLEQTAKEGEGGTTPPPKGVLVPTTAIVQRDGQSVVFVIEDGRARQRTVAPGQGFGDLRLVEGVVTGAHVVRTPPEAMHDGARVEVQKP
ncbi:MAG TPA: efflux RND transporter periplasmic adaptor subunit [Steroidobacteraceae bacterium]|jgi:RND family efflux transporter MFP subunit|nr:efflux RND transporter periplasmic adaptor subunit [Steroidobacteraceae bacterium]